MSLEELLEIFPIFCLLKYKIGMLSVFKFGTNGNGLLTPVRSAQNNRLVKGRQDEFLYLLFNTV